MDINSTWAKLPSHLTPRPNVPLMCREFPEDPFLFFPQGTTEDKYLEADMGHWVSRDLEINAYEGGIIMDVVDIHGDYFKYAIRFGEEIWTAYEEDAPYHNLHQNHIVYWLPGKAEYA